MARFKVEVILSVPATFVVDIPGPSAGANVLGALLDAVEAGGIAAASEVGEAWIRPNDLDAAEETELTDGFVDEPEYFDED